jgi:hypothetical protein
MDGVIEALYSQRNTRDQLGPPSQRPLARYANSDGNFVLVASGSFETNSTKKLIEIVYDLLIEAIQLGSLVVLEFGVGPVGLK